MSLSFMPDLALIQKAFHCACPKCAKGSLFKPGLFQTNLNDVCPLCGLNLAENDIGDGPAVFLVFILGTLIVPAALLFEKFFAPPLWMHGVLWGFVAVGITLGCLKPLKAYIIMLQYKYRPGEWKDGKAE